ncbi:MAG: DUF5067 domain-containing protein [Oscillospiraceae bacterium]|nr:DUF5067 domain-containing protein [Oscillospiraceae bacterium]
MKRITALLLSAILLFVFAACTVDTPIKIDNTPQPTDNRVELQEEEKDPVFQVGETAQLDGVTVSLVEVAENDGSKYNKPADGNVFVLCEFVIENNSDTELNVSSILSFEAYCDDYACTFSLTALMEKGNKNQLDGTVAPGKKFSGVIGYEVPEDWQTLEIHYTPDVLSSNEIVFAATNEQ